METVSVLYLAAIGLAGAVSLWSMIHSLMGGDLRTPRVFGVLSGFALLLNLSVFGLALTQVSEIGFFWTRVRFFSIGLMAVCLLLFALEFADHPLRHSRLFLTALLIIPVITQAVLWSDRAIGLFFTRWELQTVGLITVDVLEGAGWFWVQLVYNFVLAASSLWVILHFALTAKPVNHRAAAVIILVTLLGALSAMIWGLWREVSIFNPLPLLATLMTAGYFWVVPRFRLLDIMPFAYDAVFRSMRDAVIVLNKAEKIAQVNPAAVAWLNQPPEALIGKTLDAVMPIDPPEAIDTTIESKLMVDGNERTVDMRRSPLHDRSGRTIGHLVVLQDISKRKRAETAQLEQERLKIALAKETELSELKTRMMVRIAHEFRTPMTTIQAASDLLDRYQDRMTLDQRREKLMRIRQEVFRVTDMLQDMQETLRGKTDDIAPYVTSFDMAVLAREIVAKAQTTYGEQHQMILEAEDKPHPLSADREMIRAIINHLLSNAVKYSAVGTRVWLSLRITSNLVNPNSGVDIQVRDEGIGIPDDERERIFDRFFRGSNIDEVGGIGLGLSIVRDLVRAHKGEISVSSEVGKGTTFTVCLPQLEAMPLLSRSAH